MKDDIKLFSLDGPRIEVREEELLKDLQAFSKSVGGKPISSRDYHLWKSKRFSKDTYFRMFGTWHLACTKAGVRFLRKGQYDDIELIEHFEKVWRWRGQKLVQSDLLEYNKGNETTIHPDSYSRRWNGFSNFVRLFSQYKLGQITLEQLLSSKGEPQQRDLISPRLRAEVLKRDNYTCQDCGASPRKSEDVILHIHHIVPVSEGGSTSLDNLITNCDTCNQGKSNKIISK